MHIINIVQRLHNPYGQKIQSGGQASRTTTACGILVLSYYYCTGEHTAPRSKTNLRDLNRWLHNGTLLGAMAPFPPAEWLRRIGRLSHLWSHDREVYTAFVCRERQCMSKPAAQAMPARLHTTDHLVTFSKWFRTEPSHSYI